MKTTWKKRASALLLALTLTVSLMPNALAEVTGGDSTHTHVFPTEWTTTAQPTCANAGTRTRTCSCGAVETESIPATGQHAYVLETIRPATCSEAGSGISKCACGAVQGGEIIIPATGAHTLSEWGITKAPTCTEAGSKTRVCTKCALEATRETVEIPATGHNFSTTPSKNTATCTATGVATYPCANAGCTSTQEKTSPALGHTAPDSNGKCTRAGCGVQLTANITVSFATGGSSIAAQSIVKGNRPSNPGTPSKSASGRSYTFIGWTTSSTSTNVYTGQSYLSSAQVASTPISANTTYYALYRVAATSQNLSQTLPNNNAVTLATSTSQSSLYSQLYSTFSSITGLAMTRVRFGGSSGTSYGTLYTDSGRRSLYTTLDYYYSSSSYGSYPLANVYFQPSGTLGTYSIAYTASDEYGNTVQGVLSYVTNTSSSTTISYTVAPGGRVAFNYNDFNRAYQNVYSGSVRWVTFSTSDALNTTNGTVYYDYGGRNEVAFTQSTVDDYMFYYNSSSYGHYPLDSLSFAAGSNASNRTVTLAFRAYYDNSTYVDGTVEVTIGGTASNKITYSVNPGSQVAFKIEDFNRVYQNTYSGTIGYVSFSTSATMDTSNGTIYYNYGGRNEVAFTSTTIDDYNYYYSSSSYGHYPLDSLSFVAPTGASNRTVTLSFRAYYNNSTYVDGTVDIKIGSSTASKISYTVRPGEQVVFKPEDFNRAYQADYSGSVRWVTFFAPSAYDSCGGTVYYNYNGNREKSFTRTSMDDYNYYYSSSSYGDYPLDSLSFVAGSGFTSEVTLSFRAYYDNSTYVDGTVTIKPDAAETKGDILATITSGANFQINANEFARFFNKKYPNETLQYVKLNGIPETGSLYYNYYGTSNYGSSRLQLTSSNYSNQNYYYSPTSKTQYSLSDLTYIPSGSNYCVTIPFTATSTNRSVSGNLLISVSYSAVAEVYGVTGKGVTVTLPASAINTAVSKATGSTMSGIRFLSLPSPSAGALYEGNSTSTRASVSTLYNYSGSSPLIGQLRFIPASNFTGSVELPYVAYNSRGTAIASGKICLGVVNTIAKYSDMNSSTWCYKYVTELSDAKVISGYENGSFQPDGTVTYGAALKLVMLSTGYSVQKPTGSHPFSGYLTKAKANGLISGSVNLSAPISRQAMAQLAAKAMKLNTSNLSNVKPFTDTTDPYIQALNAAGIIEGYFSNGTSTFKPNNSLTRGQVSAIIWRMENAAQ